MKLPIRTLGLAVAALLIGSALAPVSAQQQSGVDGQVALRSDGALYLISNGQRRWISTVAATDEEINALPEGDPIFAGLAPQGSSQASFGPTKPSATGSTASKTPSKTTKPSSKSTSNDDDDDDDDDDDTGDDGSELDDSIPISMDIGDTRIKRGSTFTVEITTSKQAVCDLRVEVPDDDAIVEDSKNPDTRGRCRYNVDIDDSTSTGKGKVIGTAREGGKMNRTETDITIVK